MAIIIKEINVRTTVERTLNKKSMDVNDKHQLKKELLQEIKESVRQEVKRINER